VTASPGNLATHDCHIAKYPSWDASRVARAEQPRNRTSTASLQLSEGFYQRCAILFGDRAESRGGIECVLPKDFSPRTGKLRKRGGRVKPPIG
jgi:hypothetical protein